MPVVSQTIPNFLNGLSEQTQHREVLTRALTRLIIKTILLKV